MAAATTFYKWVAIRFRLEAAGDVELFFILEVWYTGIIQYDLENYTVKFIG